MSTPAPSMTPALARADMLNRASNLTPIQVTSSTVRRQTVAEQRMGGFWIKYTWGLAGFELHLHYNQQGRIVQHAVKVVASIMGGGEAHLTTNELQQVVSRYINRPAA